MSTTKKYYKLSELSQKIEEVISEQFSDSFFWVLAEVSGHKFYANTDRHYFDLVEKIENSNTETAKIKTKSWTEGSNAIKEFEQITGQKFENGLQILAQVKVEYHKIFGLSLTLYNIDSSYTLGNIERQKKATLEKLLRENEDAIKLINGEYISRNKELKLNVVIERIALIASNNSEGYHDFKHTLLKNQYGYTFIIDEYFSTVQGLEAEKELGKTFIQIFESGIKYDAVVLIRGGGAKTDFLVFDTYSLSRIIARFPIPVITGIGHLQDVSIVDLMAHTNTKTPTKSAEFIIANNRLFEENIIDTEKRLVITTKMLVDKHRKKLQSFSNSISIQSYEALKNHSNKLERFKTEIQLKPNYLIRSMIEQLNLVQQNIGIKSLKRIRDESDKLKYKESYIKATDPKKILKRGFAILSSGEKIVYKFEDLRDLNDLNIETMDSKLEVKINKIDNNE